MRRVPRLRFRIVGAAAAIATLAVTSTGALAQVRRGGQNGAPVWKGWASLELGQLDGSIDEVPLPLPRRGGELSAWLTRNSLALGLRAAGTSSEVGPSTGDVSLLVGYHVEPIRRVDGVVAFGIGSSTLTNFLTKYSDEPIVAASAQLNANYYVVGVGVDAFAAAGAHRRYAGVGLALSLGWFH